MRRTNTGFPFLFKLEEKLNGNSGRYGETVLLLPAYDDWSVLHSLLVGISYVKLMN